MLIPITCNCGRSVEDIYDAFKERRILEYQKFIKEKDLDIAPEKLICMPSADVTPKLGDIIRDYGFRRECCFKIFVGCVNFYDMFARKA